MRLVQVASKLIEAKSPARLAADLAGWSQRVERPLRIYALLVLSLLNSCSSATFLGTAPMRAGTNENGATSQSPQIGTTNANAEPTPTSTTTSSVTAANGGGTPGIIGNNATNISNNSSTTTTSTNTNTNTNTNVNTASGAYVPPNFTLCSQNYYVPATANPYLAGVANGVTLTYTLNSGDPQTPNDDAPDESPVLVAPTNTACLSPGMSLYFSVHGSISHSHSLPAYDANGNADEIDPHQLGSVLGKANITAPLDSLIAVFIGANDPTNLVPPPSLDFSSQSARDYTTISPQLGQVFFVGTGMNSSGAYHQVVVPQGATRLYFAIMDSYQWNNNVGGLYGAIMTGSPAP